jgi:hypothetical protein
MAQAVRRPAPAGQAMAQVSRRIILARPAVEAGEKLGFLPGDLQEKVNPYLRPLYDALYDMLEVERVERLIERGTIEIAPIAFMRGRTLNDAFVILDEAQNTTSEQMKMFLTRLGFGSKAVVTGDITQIDLPTGRISGPGRGDERRRQGRGHLVRLLRRSRRRAPQARAADRQGVRGVQWGRHRQPRLTHHDSDDPAANRRRARARRRPGRRPARPGPRAAWLAGVAPRRRARGEVTVALVSDGASARSTAPTAASIATDVLSFPALPPPRTRASPPAPQPRTISATSSSRQGVARRQAREAGHDERTEWQGARAARSAAPPRLRPRAGRRPDAPRRGAAAAEGRAAGRPHRAAAQP